MLTGSPEAGGFVPGYLAGRLLLHREPGGSWRCMGSARVIVAGIISRETGRLQHDYLVPGEAGRE